MLDFLDEPEDGPPLLGRWHHGEGVLVSGTIRIAQWDCDTNPPKEFRDRVLDWVCKTLNQALRSEEYERAAPAPEGEPIAWEATTLAYTKYVSDRRYNLFSPAVQRWYKPYRCSSCASPSQPAPAPEPAEEYSLSWIEHEAESLSRSQPVAAEGLTDAQIDEALEAWFASGPVGMEHKTDRTRMRAAIAALSGSAESKKG